MAKGGGSRARTGGRGRDAAKRPATGKPAKRRASGNTPKAAPVAEPSQPGPFRLGAIPGATPGKWIDVWRERMPRTALELVPLEVARQREALLDGSVDAALVRLPLDTTGLHVIPLYDEAPVVVVPADSHLTAADELDPADLEGEVLVTPADDVLGILIPGTVAPSFEAPTTTGDAIATVAAGVGVVVVPMSLARLHHRKDAEYRPLRAAAPSTVALAWPAHGTTASVEAFVGIVRGRTANSSRR
ncbi:LysR substrate-binding domain-containing protein [Microbacterium ulmi]|uniref:Transcriptional regulator n=1 Tax=Microbacterium ulmi TaxID=179095 RepID=A0A7Y2PZU0_9MICO|nr:LysR substrate-binding domain-containing protein [Microbacterium ulmi]NII70024.1 DNA-binding transcriptional LysR family regulator [Microbacterium ulmi]NNH04826.1 transcriptional regulator [Microbacterium ulmi]